MDRGASLGQRVCQAAIAAGLLVLFAIPGSPGLRARARLSATAFAPSPLVAEMMAEVQAGEIYSYTAGLTGEHPLLIGGAAYTLTSRYTASGLPIQQATEYAAERLQSLGVASAYAPWATASYSGRNVVGVITGTTRPNEIVLMTAHLDDMPSWGLAPGADDDASGSTALLAAAGAMRDYRFERTVRFVFFTGEEQGMLGSSQYAAAAHDAGETIVGVVNVDMIGWDQAGGPVLRLHARNNADDLALAEVFINVVSAYGLNSQLTPIVSADGMGRSDHASFWTYGFPAILAIEDNANDFNPYYHSANDRLQNINLAYDTNIVKASVGAVAHLALPLQRIAGQVAGAITDAASGAPLADVTVQAIAGTRTYTASTDATGTYTLTAYPATYSLSAWKYGYALESIAGVGVISDVTVSPVNFALTPTLPYSLTGCVTDAATAAPVSATVSVQGPFGDPLAQAAAPLPAGCYAFTLLGGPYTLSAQAPLHAPAASFVHLASDTVQNIALPATTLNGQLWGRVANQAHGPIAGASLSAASGQPLAVSDAAGAYSLELPPGDYTLTIAASGYASLDSQVRVPQSNLAQYNFELAPLHYIFLPMVKYEREFLYGLDDKK